MCYGHQSCLLLCFKRNSLMFRFVFLRGVRVVRTKYNICTVLFLFQKCHNEMPTLVLNACGKKVVIFIYFFYIFLLSFAENMYPTWLDTKQSQVCGDARDHDQDMGWT